MGKCFRFSFFYIFLLIGKILTTWGSDLSLRSDIFWYEDNIEAKKLHVSLIGSWWQAEDVKWDHLAFHQSLFSNPKLMTYYAEGKAYSPQSVSLRFQNSIEEIFAQGYPTGMLTIKDLKNPSIFLMYAMMRESLERSGSATLSLVISMEHQEKRLGSDFLSSVVNEWAPEVRRIGLGLNIDNKNIIKAFQCFGGKELEVLEATVSPANIRSLKCFDKLNFQTNYYKIDSSFTFDFSLKEITPEELENNLYELYDPIKTEKPLIVGKRYCLIDMNNKKRVFSKHSVFKTVKFHFEKTVEIKNNFESKL